MTPQERDLITTLLTRLKSAGAAGQQKDAEADALIRQAVREQPDMPYYLVQTVLIQDLSLNQAQSRIAELEQQLAEAKSQKSSGTSFLGGLFGRSEPPPQQEQPSGPWSRGPQVAPQQQYNPGPGPGPGYAQQGYGQNPGYPPQGYAQPQAGGMLGGGGGGFLRSAAATAAGVAGGALLFQGISSMFGHGYANSLYSGGGANPGLGETVINNYYGDNAPGGDYGGGDYGSGSDPGYTGGGPDYGGDGDYGGGDSGGDGDYGGGGDNI